MAQQQEQRLDSLKQKYQSVLNVIQQSGVRLTHVHVQDNKLFIQGEAPSEQTKNRVWDQIKLVDPTYSDLTCDLTVNPSLAGQGAAQQAGSAAAGSRSEGRRRQANVHGLARRLAVQDQPALLRFSERLQEDCRSERRPAEQSGCYTSGADVEDPRQVRKRWAS